MTTSPEPVTAPCIQDLVVADMREVQEHRRIKYGTLLYPHNGSDGLREAYEEAIDMAIYLRQVLYERDGK
jgi:hypothetical protein